MPLKSEKVEVTYTSDEEIGYLIQSEDKDYNVEFVGFIKSVEGRVTRTVDDEEKELYKCVITNGSQNIPLIIWDAEKIKQVSGNLVTDQILHLDGCEGQTVTKKNHHRAQNLLNYELIIQPGTIVNFMGLHVRRKVQKAVPTILFSDIPKATGLIKVRAYLKTVVTQAYNRNGPMAFGSGSVTEGIHKLPINISSFKPEDSANHVKGACVMLTGTISRSGPLLLTCQDISSIEILQGEKPLEKNIITSANMPMIQVSAGLKRPAFKDITEQHSQSSPKKPFFHETQL